jgi:hypothetical protein
MRKILVATLIAGGVGLTAVPGATAAPLSGPAVRDAATVVDQTVPVGWHNRWRSHWRWGSRGGHWRWGSRRWWR